MGGYRNQTAGWMEHPILDQLIDQKGIQHSGCGQQVTCCVTLLIGKINKNARHAMFMTGNDESHIHGLMHLTVA